MSVFFWVFFRSNYHCCFFEDNDDFHFFFPVAFAVQPIKCYSLSYFFPFHLSIYLFIYLFFTFPSSSIFFLHHIGAVKWPSVKEQTVCVWDISCWFSGTLAWWIAQQKTPNNSWFATCSLRLNNIQHLHLLRAASNDSSCELWSESLHQSDLSEWENEWISHWLWSICWNYSLTDCWVVKHAYHHFIIRMFLQDLSYIMLCYVELLIDDALFANWSVKLAPIILLLHSVWMGL